MSATGTERRGMIQCKDCVFWQPPRDKHPQDCGNDESPHYWTKPGPNDGCSLGQPCAEDGEKS